MEIRAADHGYAAHSLIDWIASWAANEQFQAIGHRIVHGGVGWTGTKWSPPIWFRNFAERSRSTWRTCRARLR